MSVEQYSEDVIVVAVADGPSAFKVWLREEAPADLASDLRWLCEEYMDSHVILDLADLNSLETASYRPMLDLRALVEESDFRFVLCGLSPHVQWQLRCVHLFDGFDTFDSREAALRELAPQDTR
ncbi:MAG: STAS domain-containing protein [Planctomycetes bacterium]|jgi:anti-anti-sigma regulatory factor|nr:STAS domain-containing protein [Planctomycetota bacterium]